MPALAGFPGVHDAHAQRGQLGELGVDAVQDGLQAPLLGLAGGGAGVVCGERVYCLTEREADRLQLARELNAPDGLGPVVAVAGGGTSGRRQDADALVEAARAGAPIACDMRTATDTPR